MNAPVKYTKKDFVSDQEIRWCPGCGDYAILSSLQLALSKMGKKKEETVCISGIGCSSRFPYYMNTYGLHTIHGRAPAFATGLKLQNPELSVWVITGDGDGMSIGGNHLIHVLRRNVDLNILLFNNEIYGLTKGQYSPTSKQGLVTKSTPYGSLDRKFSTAKLALGASATFIARTIDTDPKHMMEIFTAAYEHKGTSFVEIFQNCVIFNDKVHDDYTNRKTRDDTSIRLEHGKPMIYGANRDKGLILQGPRLKTVTIGQDGITENDLLVHDETDENLSFMLGNLTPPNDPVPLGILRKVAVPSYEAQVNDQIQQIKEKNNNKASVADLLHSGDTWTVN